MADAGLSMRCIPYNIVGAQKLARLAALNTRITLSVTADSAVAPERYAKTFVAGGERCSSNATRRGPLRRPVTRDGAGSGPADHRSAGPPLRRPHDLSGARQGG